MYTIRGTVGLAADRFTLNLQTGPGKTDDIVFHFNPRFDSSSCVVRNDRLDDNWNKEEREGGLPFKDSEPFVLVIGVTKQGFETWVDGKEFIKFAHRQDLSTISCLVVEGDVSVQDVSIDSVPQKMPPQSEDDSIIDTSKSALQLFFPKVPVTAIIPAGLGPKKMFIISGIPDIEGGTVQLHLRAGSNEPESDVPYHFSARLEKDNSKTLHNSRKDGEWQEEAILPQDSFVLKPGERFDLYITWQESGYAASLNGEEYATFPHRIDDSKIDQIYIFGDLTVQRLVIL